MSSTQKRQDRSDMKIENMPSSTLDPSMLSATSSGSAAVHSTLGSDNDIQTPSADSSGFNTPGLLTRSPSLGATSNYGDQDELEQIPPLDRLTVFDFLENLALPQRLERLQNTLSAQKEKVRKQQAKIKKDAQERVAEEWRKRAPPEEQLARYRKRMRSSVDRINKRWNDARTVTNWEKVSFIAGVLNIFISGYLVGAFPEYFHLWYTVQVAYFYPVRLYKYRRRGYHYFLFDLCYFVNLLLILTIWVAPQSKRLFISTFCLAFGNNAIAIAMWRNSLVFHSLDKVTSLFIHIMPCVTLHCMIHLIPRSLQHDRFPGLYSIKHSDPNDPQHYSLASMVIWSTLPYACWQLLYHFLITVRRRDQISAGRPTSFTWLRKSYASTWIGKLVLALPEYLQEPAFMLIQYSYALLTMLPAPLWFWFRWASASFLMTVFTWSVYNGANYYIDVFGRRFQKELDELKAEVSKWQNSPELMAKNPASPTNQEMRKGNGKRASGQQLDSLNLGAAAMESENTSGEGAGQKETDHSSGYKHESSSSEDYSVIDVSTSNLRSGSSTGAEQRGQGTADEGVRERSSHNDTSS